MDLPGGHWDLSDPGYHRWTWSWLVVWLPVLMLDMLHHHNLAWWPGPWLLPLHPKACSAHLGLWDGPCPVRTPPCWLWFPLGSWAKGTDGLCCVLMWSLELETAQSLLLWKQVRIEKVVGCGSTHSLYACCNWSYPYWASRDEGQKSLWNLLLVAVCSKHQLSLQLSVMQIQTRKGCHLSREGLGTFWPQCQTWHMADFWMSQCGHSRPGILKEVPVQASGCELLVPLEFSTLLKLLPATEASCHLSSEQLGSISEPLWASRSMPATHPRQKDTFWHVTLTKLSAYSKHNWWRMEERYVQFLCHPPPSCSVFPYTCQLTLL